MYYVCVYPTFEKKVHENSGFVLPVWGLQNDLIILYKGRSSKVSTIQVLADPNRIQQMAHGGYTLMS